MPATKTSKRSATCLFVGSSRANADSDAGQDSSMVG